MLQEGREPPEDTNIDSETASRSSRPPSPPSGPPSSGSGDASFEIHH